MGKIIKNFVAVMVSVGLLVCVVCFFVGSSLYEENDYYIEYASVFGGATELWQIRDGYESKGNKAVAGGVMKTAAIPVALFLAISAIPLYGFGALVEASENSEQRLGKIENSVANIEKQLTAPSKEEGCA